MRLFVTRKFDPKFAAKLKKAGFKAVFLPLITIKPLKDKKSFKKNFSKKWDWIVLTSPNAVQAAAPFLKKRGSAKVAAVGPATAAALKSAGIKSYRPKKSGGAQGLIPFFKKRNIWGKKILYPASNIAGKELKKGLQNMGGVVKQFAAYRTVPNKRRRLVKKTDAVLFFSPSAVANFPKSLGKNIPMIPFGKTTAQALRAAGFKPAFVPSQSADTAFVHELKCWFFSKQKPL